MTRQPGEHLVRLYPEIGLAGSLQAAMQTALDHAGYELTAVLTSAPGWWDCATRVGDAHRHVSVNAGSQQRWFLMEFWDRGVMMAKAKTGDLSAAAEAIGLWQAGSRLRELKAACLFVEYGPLAEAHERGDAVEAKWAIYRNTSAPHVDHDLIEAAYAQPRLRALFPFHSHRSLHFSRCTGFPYTHDIPVIGPRPDGTYRVVWWQVRSPHGPAIGEVDNPHDAIALVIAHLPADCGSAVAGTPPTLTDRIPRNDAVDVALPEGWDGRGDDPAGGAVRVAQRRIGRRAASTRGNRG
ncbi:DUF6193 family natural product biosynthesis protein [Actinoallomurus sp. CA-150999]|uniref:DUF6193 family natural product biosynthesis protein n=1 Tax=Actinoallomurus sp. CA-150999 TaxID=3239887 RepID=UPI003D92CAD0